MADVVAVPQNVDIRITRLRDGRWRVTSGGGGVTCVTGSHNALDALRAFCDVCLDLDRQVSTPERRFWISQGMDFAPIGVSK